MVQSQAAWPSEAKSAVRIQAITHGEELMADQSSAIPMIVVGGFMLMLAGPMTRWNVKNNRLFPHMEGLALGIFRWSTRLAACALLIAGVVSLF